MSSPKVLLAGGTGYIGAHTCLEMLQENMEVVIIDNFHNSDRESIRRVEKLTGKSAIVEEVDIMNREALDGVFKKYNIDTVIHFAALKSVGESVAKPLWYYQNNIAGTLNLVEVMSKHGCKNIVFSSSATVYGDPKYLPLTEDHPLAPTNPYGQTKFMVEQILKDVAVSDPEWNVVLLRYFNPVGAHKSGEIGEDPSGVPANLMPFVAQVAVGRREHVNVFGDDYDTKDGTGVRDYIHVVDLAKGHVAAVRHLKEKCGCVVYNLGTGAGYSVLDMIKAMEKSSGKTIPYKIAPRRPGDIASCYADPCLAQQALKWKAEYGLQEMCDDLWNWQIKNPNGYGKK
eukprot:Nk52_evm1s311 gene=Nk52_evmTU1s311